MKNFSQPIHPVPDSLLISYQSLRRLIGVLALLLPLLCWFFASAIYDLPLLSSISSYYFTNVRDIFVGTLVGISFFLISYRGYERIDNWVTNTSGVLGILIAFFPTLPSGYGQTAANCNAIGFLLLSCPTANSIHIIAASLFFLFLAVNAFFLFTKGSQQPTRQKKQRNLVYRLCGSTIFVLWLVTAFLAVFKSGAAFQNSSLLFYLETAMLWAFAISWLIKGEFLLKDKKT